jgi:hypothetical protein
LPFVLITLVLAVGLSYPRGGRLSRIADAPLRRTWLLFVGVGLQVLTDLGAGRGILGDASLESYLLILASQVLIVVWVASNWTLPGMVLVALGLGLNALVIGLNGAMPVHPDAIAALGIEGITVMPGKHTLLDDSTRLPWLADVWAIPILRSIISIGDVVLAAGLIPVTHSLMTYRHPTERRRPSGAKTPEDA